MAIRRDRFQVLEQRIALEAVLADAWALVAPSLWAEPLGFVAIGFVSIVVLYNLFRGQR